MGAAFSKPYVPAVQGEEPWGPIVNCVEKHSEHIEGEINLTGHLYASLTNCNIIPIPEDMQSELKIVEDAQLEFYALLNNLKRQGEKAWDRFLIALVDSEQRELAKFIMRAILDKPPIQETEGTCDHDEDETTPKTLYGQDDTEIV